MNQRNLLLALIALSLSASGGLGWYIINTPNETPGVALTLQQGAAYVPSKEGPTPSPQQSSSALITERTVSFMTAGPTSTSVLFVDTPSGRVYRIDTETREEVPLSLRIPDLIDVRWSPLKTSLIARVRTPQGEQLKFVRLGEQKTSVLQKAVAAAFSPDGLSIATLEPGEPGGIFTQKLDGSERVQWTQTRALGGDLFWPQQNTLSLLVKNQSSQTGDVLLISRSGELGRVIAHHRLPQLLWAPNGEALLHTAQQGGEASNLFITTLTGSYEVGVATSPHLCAWRKNSAGILCVVKSGQETRFVSYALGTEKVSTTPSGTVTAMGARSIAINTLETSAFVVPASGVGIYTVPLSGLQ